MQKFQPRLTRARTALDTLLDTAVEKLIAALPYLIFAVLAGLTVLLFSLFFSGYFTNAPNATKVAAFLKDEYPSLAAEIDENTIRLYGEECYAVVGGNSCNKEFVATLRSNNGRISGKCFWGTSETLYCTVYEENLPPQ